MEVKFNKKIIALAIILFLLTTAIPGMATNLKKQNTQIPNSSTNEKIITINILDLTSQQPIKKTTYLSYTDAKNLLEALNSFELAQESIQQQIIEKINLLKNNNLIPHNTALWLQNIFEKQQLSEIQHHNQQGPIFDVFNFFNGIFFGLKGSKDRSILELNVTTFPFINGNITAQFSVMTKFTGNGSVFTLGTLGFRYEYEFDKTKYEFPYFPVISGSIIGYSGILIEVKGLSPELSGSYVVGVGMTILTIWNRLT